MSCSGKGSAMETKLKHKMVWHFCSEMLFCRTFEALKDGNCGN